MKIALCLSGSFRGNYKAVLSDLKKYIISNNDIDVFIFTWNNYYKWAQLKGGGERFILRVAGEKMESSCPLELKTRSSFQKIAPKTYKILTTDCIIPINSIKNEIESILSPVSFHIESEDDFESTFTNRAIPNINIYKLFYGRRQVYLDLVSFIKKQNIHYDLIIETRPDLGYKNFFDIDNINLGTNELGVEYYPAYGPQDQFHVFSSILTLDKVTDIWNWIAVQNKFKIASSHFLLLTWLIKNNIKISKISVPRLIYKANFGCIPNFYDQLKDEFINKIQDQKSIEQLCTFLDNLKKEGWFEE